jgi:hypothetical protein
LLKLPSKASSAFFVDVNYHANESSESFVFSGSDQPVNHFKTLVWTNGTRRTADDDDDDLCLVATFDPRCTL